ncbi:MAG: hypothetical protein COT81_00850 [Candidatus Buchananbacteria bacterium CG10_big_fil_rev_8_21_14_0_10_42_9]|uniref:VanZ-like domain-containing protein n=1 Tax=Candidatus Buchananbacteria bacterium CG10_big_fil_rev_8_21_14_0_10_42_9 TaxID=1974526 RepID=A0A2H0W2L9_9BACT|nr:MAG: hypothetical protein COT81_00850 [Candidatus Buchananbacteria bacterium CG10_big_fil_rev_8_21_14_0_10_42_9]
MRNSINQKFFVFASLAVWLGLMLWLSSQPDIPRTQTIWDIVLSNLVHLGEYFGLAYFLSNALSSLNIKSHHVAGLVFLMGLTTAVFDEYYQGFINNRISDVKDILVDSVALLIFIYLSWREHKYENSSHQ